MKIMIKTLPSLLLVIHGAEVEGHGTELLGDLREEFATGLHLEHVGVFRLLVDRDLGVPLPALTFSGADEDVNGVDLGDVKL